MATTLEMLKAVLGDGRTEGEHREAFEGMNKFLQDNPGRSLTRTQAQYIEDFYIKWELDVNDTLNLISSGKAPRGKEVAMPWEKRGVDGKLVMDRPLVPPHRRPLEES